MSYNLTLGLILIFGKVLKNNNIDFRIFQRRAINFIAPKIKGIYIN